MSANRPQPLFCLDGSPVFRGEVLHVAPEYHYQAGAQVTAEFMAEGESVTVRSFNGAVPHVPISALSRKPHAKTLLLETMRKAGINRPSDRDIAVWEAAQNAMRPVRSDVHGV